MFIGVTEHCHFVGMVTEDTDDEEEEENEKAGKCSNCGTFGALGHYCEECEDSGLIYESYSAEDEKPAERTPREGEVLEPGICGECYGPGFVNEQCTRK